MACIVMAYIAGPTTLYRSAQPYSYGLYSCGLCSYGIIFDDKQESNGAESRGFWDADSTQMHVDMCVGMRIVMHVDMSMDMFANMGTDMHIHAYGHARRHEYTCVRNHRSLGGTDDSSTERSSFFF